MVIEVIRTAAAETDGVIAAWLFGSTARGEPNPRDLDLALLWRGDVQAVSRWRGGERLARALELRMPDPRNVEIVDLREAPPSLQHRILTEGRRVFERDPVERTRFEASTLSMATDFVEWQKPLLERWRRAVADGR